MRFALRFWFKGFAQFLSVCGQTRKTFGIVLLSMAIQPALPGVGCAAFLGDTFKPFASLSETYDSNLFRVRDAAQQQALTGDDRLSDFITVASVGAGLHYRVSLQEMNLLLKKDFIRHNHYSDQDADRNDARGQLLLSVLDKVRVTLDGSFLEAPESRNDFSGSRPNIITTLAGGITTSYQMPSGIGFEAAYRRTSVGYSLAQFKANEYAVDRYSAGTYYRSAVGTRLYATYLHDDTTYDQEIPVGSTLVNNSSSADSVRLGLEETISPKTTVSGFVGYLDRRHAASSSARDFSGVVGKVALSYALTQKLGFLLNWERQLYEETYTDRIYSVNDLLGLGVTYRIAEKLKGTLSDRVSWKDFRDLPGSGAVPRSDFTQEFSSGVEWTPLNRLTVNLGYQYSIRHSDDEAFNFSDHMVTAAVAYGF